jgi:hypothetical protein
METTTPSAHGAPLDLFTLIRVGMSIWQGNRALVAAEAKAEEAKAERAVLRSDRLTALARQHEFDLRREDRLDREHALDREDSRLLREQEVELAKASQEFERERLSLTLAQMGLDRDYNRSHQDERLRYERESEAERNKLEHERSTWMNLMLLRSMDISAEELDGYPLGAPPPLPPRDEERPVVDEAPRDPLAPVERVVDLEGPLSNAADMGGTRQGETGDRVRTLSATYFDELTRTKGGPTDYGTSPSNNVIRRNSEGQLVVTVTEEQLVRWGVIVRPAAPPPRAPSPRNIRHDLESYLDPGYDVGYRRKNDQDEDARTLTVEYLDHLIERHGAPTHYGESDNNFRRRTNKVGNEVVTVPEEQLRRWGVI